MVQRNNEEKNGADYQQYICDGRTLKKETSVERHESTLRLIIQLHLFIIKDPN